MHSRGPEDKSHTGQANRLLSPAWLFEKLRRQRPCRLCVFVQEGSSDRAGDDFYQPSCRGVECEVPGEEARNVHEARIRQQNANDPGGKSGIDRRLPVSAE